MPFDQELLCHHTQFKIADAPKQKPDRHNAARLFFILFPVRKSYASFAALNTEFCAACFWASVGEAAARYSLKPCICVSVAL